MIALSVAPEDGEGTCYDKPVSELQTGIVVDEDSISGTVHYVEDYVGFNPANPDEQEGNFLAVKVEADPEAAVKFDLIGGKKGEITLPPEDRQVVCRLTDKDKQSIRVTAEKKGGHNTKKYSLTGLTLETKDG